MKQTILISIFPSLINIACSFAETFFPSFGISSETENNMKEQNSISTTLFCIFQQFKTISLDCYRSFPRFVLTFTMISIFYWVLASIIRRFSANNSSGTQSSDQRDIFRELSSEKSHRFLALSETAMKKLIYLLLCYFLITTSLSLFHKKIPHHLCSKKLLRTVLQF